MSCSTPGIGGFLFKNAYPKRDMDAHFRKVFHDPSRLPSDFVDYYWERFKRPGTGDALHANLRNIAALAEVNPWAPQVKCPTLIGWGDDDRVIPIEQGRKLLAVIAGTRMEVVPSCGHSPHEEKPKPSAEEIAANKVKWGWTG